MLDRFQQPIDVVDALGNDDAELGQMGADRVHGLGLLADEEVPRPVIEQRRLGVCRLHRDEPHGGPGDSLANCLCVRAVGLAAFYIRLHVGFEREAIDPVDRS